MDKYRSFGGYNGSSYILNLHNMNDSLFDNTNNYYDEDDN